MKGIILFVLLSVLVLATSASADFAYVRSIGTPHGTTDLTGMAAANGALFAVERIEGQGSCLYLIDPATGAILREACLDGNPPGYPGMPLQFESCAFNPWGDLALDPLLGFDAYWVGDASGTVIRYKWTDTYGPAHAGHCELVGIPDPVGLTCVGDLVHILDHGTSAIYPLRVCFGQPPDPIHLPSAIGDPSALCYHNGNWFVADATAGAIYELDTAGALVETHVLGAFVPGTVKGITFLDDNLFVASDAGEIMVFEFDDGRVVADVPEGINIIVEPLPDELEIEFPAVADSGSLFVDVNPTDPCPIPQGVVFLPDFYDIFTTASFEYIARVALITSEPLPPGIDPDKVRIFKRPSGDCLPWRDVTVEPIELFEPGETLTLGRLTRTLSEEDEFSLFVLAEDRRNLSDIVALKFTYLEEAIDAVGGTPIDPIREMQNLLTAARRAFNLRRYGRAAALVDRIADVAMATPEIPYLFLPYQPGSNLGGAIVARAHTLSFSIRMLAVEEVQEDPEIGGRLKDGPTNVAEASRADISVIGSNPSRRGFSVSLSGTGAHPVSVRIYSVTGELVATLLDGAVLSSSRTLAWDGSDSAGEKVGNGVYFLIVRAGEETATRKLILQR